MATEGLNIPAAATSPENDPSPPRKSWLENFKEHRRTWLAIRGFREVILIGAVYTMYDLTRYLVKGDRAGAISNGKTIFRYERDLHLDPEHALNTLFSHHIALGLPSDYIYASLHYIVTPIVLVWMWRRHPTVYSQSRTVLMVATIVGLLGFTFLPTAPPRLLHGFIDTMSRYSHYGWWSNAASAPRGLGADTNQYAAFPSLHVGWALWSGWQLFRYGRHRVTQVLGVLYPIVLSVVVIATANHYLIDVLAGVAVVGVAAVIVVLLEFIGVVPRPDAFARQAAESAADEVAVGHQ